jgi:release factor glutamine methyltransferase
LLKIVTLEEALREAFLTLKASPHPESARRDAELLLIHVLGCERVYLIAHPEEELSLPVMKAYREMIERRTAGEPIQYITGQQEFYGLPFLIRPGVLIPRPETEHLIEAAINAATGYEAPRILDVGSGSGAIAVTLAHQLRKATVTATDISPIALELSKENARRNGVEDRTRFLQANLMEGFEGEQFEIIVSNPPYVPQADREMLSVEVREYEPGLALFAGLDGLDIYRRLIPEAYQRLVPSGWLLLEIGFGQSEKLRPLLIENGFEAIVFHPDLQGIPRIVQARKL